MLRNLEYVGKFFALTFFINFPLNKISMHSFQELSMKCRAFESALHDGQGSIGKEQVPPFNAFDQKQSPRESLEFFNQLRSNMLARTHHYAKIFLCDDVRYTMHLINEIRNNTHIVGDINVNCYRALVNQLLFECYNYDEIIKIVKDQQEIDKQYRRSVLIPNVSIGNCPRI